MKRSEWHDVALPRYFDNSDRNGISEIYLPQIFSLGNICCHLKSLQPLELENINFIVATWQGKQNIGWIISNYIVNEVLK